MKNQTSCKSTIAAIIAVFLLVWYCGVQTVKTLADTAENSPSHVELQKIMDQEGPQ